MNNTIIKDVAKEWDLSSLSQNKQAEMAERLGRMLYQALLVRSLDILSESEQDELDSILDNDDATPEKVIAFLRSKIPTFNTLLKEEKDNLKYYLFG